MVYVCEGDTLRLNCGEDRFIKMWSALYGRANPTYCPDDTVKASVHHCRADKSNFETMRGCDGKNSCEIEASDAVFGDPCPDETSKWYLQVEYYCRSERPSECNPKGKLTSLKAVDTIGNYSKFLLA